MIIFDLKPKHRDEIRFTRNIEHFYGAHIRRDFAPEEREARGGQVGSPPARPAETPPRGHVEVVCSQPNAAPPSLFPPQRLQIRATRWPADAADASRRQLVTDYVERD